MTVTTDRVALDDWYVVGIAADIRAGVPRTTRLLGQDLRLARGDDGTIGVAVRGGGRAGEVLPVRERWGFVWTTLGAPRRGLFALAEADEPDRRVLACGAVGVAASGLRLVENFLDMAHFPFVHTDILGTLDRPEVAEYRAEIRADVDEVWATDCSFWQPLAARSSTAGQVSRYLYRVATPFNVVLYKTCPEAPDRQDAIALLVQPVETDYSIAYPLLALIDHASTDADIVMFQQRIFLQDRIVLENQRPRRLPLDARAEIPTRADLSSVAYRRWLKDKGLRYGVHEHGAV